MQSFLLSHLGEKIMKKNSGLVVLILFCFLSYLVISQDPLILKADALTGNFFKILVNKNATFFLKL